MDAQRGSQLTEEYVGGLLRGPREGSLGMENLKGEQEL